MRSDRGGFKRWQWLGVLCWLWLVVACQRDPGPRVTPVASPPPPPPAITRPTEAPRPSPTPGPLVLTIWAPTALSPGNETESGRLLERMLAGFEAEHPTIRLRYEAKSLSGRASLLRQLRASRTVAPTTLPDIALVPIADLPELVRAGVCQPFDTLLAIPSDDLFPLAQTPEGGTLLGLPLLLSLEHLVYRPTAGQPAPTTWSSFLEDESTLVFPLGASDGFISNAVLLHYLTVASELPSEARPLRPEPLRELLEIYAQMIARQRLPGDITEFVTPSESWQYFISHPESVAGIDSFTFLQRASETSGVAYSALQGVDGRPVTVADGYMVIVPTADPHHQAAVATYLDWLMAPEQLGPWAGRGGWLPTRRSALISAVPNAGYRGFVIELLQRAHLRPSGPAWTPISQTLNQQLHALLDGRTTVDTALEAIMAVVP